MSRILGIFCLVFALCAAASAQAPIARAQSSADKQQQREFERQFQGIAARIKSVWDTEIVASALDVYPDIDVKLMRSVEFVTPDDPCRYRININPLDQQFEVPLH